MFARTPRLILRPGWKEDAPALAAALDDYAVVEKLGQLRWPFGIAEAEALLAQDHGALPNFLIFARTHGAPRLVGGIGLSPAANDVELGYWIARPYWGLGFATEAGRAVTDIADHSLRLPSLVAGHFCDDPASARVLAKLGFEATGEVASVRYRARGSVEVSHRYVRRAGANGQSSSARIGYDREDALAA